MELNELIENVQQWSIDRGLDKADSKKQLLKLYEEFGELASGIAKNKPEVIMDSIGDCVVVLIILAQQQGIQDLDEDSHVSSFSQINGAAREIGRLSSLVCDVLYEDFKVQLQIETILSKLHGEAEFQKVKFEDCLEMAWNAIKDRKGKLVNGVWVKEEDLPGSEVSPEQTLDAVVEADVINNPSHYQGRNGLEAMEVVRQFAPCPEYIEGGYWTNVAEYFFRAYKNNGVEDLKKARKTLDWLIEELENGQKNQN